MATNEVLFETRRCQHVSEFEIVFHRFKPQGIARELAMSDEKILVLPEHFDYEYSKKLLHDYPQIFLSATSPNIILDFSRVQYLDSSALGMLVLLHKKAGESRLKIVIRGARNEAAEILKMANIQKIIDFQ